MKSKISIFTCYFFFQILGPLVSQNIHTHFPLTCLQLHPQLLSTDANFLNGEIFFRFLKIRDLALRGMEHGRKGKELIFTGHIYYMFQILCFTSNLFYKPTGKVDTITYIFLCHTWSSEGLGKLPKMTQLLNGRAEVFYYVFVYLLFRRGLGTHSFLAPKPVFFATHYATSVGRKKLKGLPRDDRKNPPP